jgi:uncharacterized membrane-anchored protein
MRIYRELLSKVPAVTLVFWIIKIAATTLGETGGDTVTMTMNWGYLAGTALFLGMLIVLVVLQIVAHRFHPLRQYREHASRRGVVLDRNQLLADARHRAR